VKMLIAPIIFCTVVGGLAGMSDLRRLGRVGWKALLYFEVVTTLALIVGLFVANAIQPGAGIHIVPSADDLQQLAAYQSTAREHGIVPFLLNVIPETFVGAFANGEILQVLLLAVLCGIALARSGARGAMVTEFLHDVSNVLFGVVAIVTRAAPVAAFGAMAFTIGKYGLHTLLKLGQLMAGVYITCGVFVFVVLGAIARLHGFSIWRILKLIKEELLIVLGTSSSETVLPLLIAKLKSNGCRDTTVGIIVPSGYSFNLDGTSIYLTMAVIFIAQATNTPLTLGEELGILAVLLLTSKGAAAVTGGGFITLAATLQATHKLPVEGLALLVGVDRFMSEARAITNLIGNTLATLVVSKWEGEFDAEKGAAVVAKGSEVP